jgi:hypothetical protein
MEAGLPGISPCWECLKNSGFIMFFHSWVVLASASSVEVVNDNLQKTPQERSKLRIFLPIRIFAIRKRKSPLGKISVGFPPFLT